MKTASSLPALAGALLLSASLVGSLGGCAVYDTGYGGYYGSAVAVAPPPSRVEVYGVAPGPGYVWSGGYWNWVGRRHEWVGGHWEAPRPGYRWRPNRWEHRRDGWHLGRGHWERHR